MKGGDGDLRQNLLLYIFEELTNEWGGEVHAEDLQKFK